nr:hypothetical protein CFP56_55667 [Quercus suber]
MAEFQFKEKRRAAMEGVTETLRILFSHWISFLSIKLDVLLGFEKLGLLATAKCGSWTHGKYTVDAAAGSLIHGAVGDACRSGSARHAKVQTPILQALMQGIEDEGDADGRSTDVGAALGIFEVPTDMPCCEAATTASGGRSPCQLMEGAEEHDRACHTCASCDIILHIFVFHLVV